MISIIIQNQIRAQFCRARLDRGAFCPVACHALYSPVMNTIERLVVVILAGGSGTRLWPRSRQSLPKQFLDLTGHGTMLQETYRRLTPLVPPEHILVITNAQYVELARNQLPDLPADHIVGEPLPRGTAAAVGLGAWGTAENGDGSEADIVAAQHRSAAQRGQR